ncbi:MAG TPA: hypothetical protein P5254_09780 [Aquihabitans sp.]|nr:hypothetical protein [Aquihabitans sp.]
MSGLVAMYLLACGAVGVGLTGSTRLPLRFEERLAVAPPLGVLVVALWCWVASLAIGFGRTSVGLAVVLATLTSLHGWTLLGPDLRTEAADALDRVRRPWRDPQSLRPLLLLLAVAWPLSTRIFALAWASDGAGGIDAGHLSTWSDGAAHLAYAGRFVSGGEVPIDSPLAAGEPARYHLLADAFGAQLSLLGTSLTSALAVASGFLALAFPAVAYLCGVRLLRSRGAALAGVVVFCAGGTLGFAPFLRDLGDHGLSVLWHLPRDYTRDPANLLWMDNPSLAYLHAQRNGLLGLPLGLVALTLVREGVDRRCPRALTAAGVLVGLVPIANGFAFVVPMAVVTAWALLDRRRPWWRFFGPALVLGLPVARWLQPPDSAVRWLPGWMAGPGLDGWLVFWARNLGPFLVLLLVAHLWRGTVPRSVLRWFAPVWLLWLVPNLVAFHPWEWNNTKYFAFWQLLGAFLVGAVLARLWRSGIAGHRPIGMAAVGLSVVLLCGTGALDLARATQRSARIPWATADGVEVAEWIRDRTDADDVVVAAPSNTEPVIALSGRRMLSGFPGWTFDLGVPDWYQREQDALAVLRGGDAAREAVARRGVDLVVIGPLERAEPVLADGGWWEANAEVVHRQGDWTVYRVER